MPQPPSSFFRTRGGRGFWAPKAAAWAAALVFLVGSGACRKRPPQSRETPPEITPPPSEPAPPPPSLPVIPYKKLETARLFSGIRVKTSLQADFGSTATTERQDPSSYELDLQLKVRVPRAHLQMPELTKLNSELPRTFPALSELLSTATISPLYEELYQRKIAHLQQNLNRLDALLSRHNFFDTETILELEHPGTHRRALLVQADMDVDTDGSDGDRVGTMEGLSSTFQPFTSYRWPKRTKRPNPFLAPWEKKLKDCEKDLESAQLSPQRLKELRDQQSELKIQISELKSRSFLVGSTDPFVVLPLPMLSRKSGKPPAQIGDFCVVLHGSRLYPAIVGDAGPSYKSGEASLRICREISSRANGGARPESELKVTYLVFPNTALSPREAPDPERWWSQCDALLQEMGGYSGELFFFQDTTKPKPQPPPYPGDPGFIGPLLDFLGPPPP